MESDNLKKKVQAAKDAVKGLEEPLKTKAFEIILNKLLKEDEVQQTSSHIPTQPKTNKDLEEDLTDRLMTIIDSTAHPLMYQLNTTLDKALYLLFIAKKYHDVDGLSASQIARLLSMKFRIATTKPATGMSLGSAGNLVNRQQVKSSGGLAYQYRIMHAGEKHISEMINNPPTTGSLKTHQKKARLTPGTKESRKTSKLGLKSRILKLKENNFFDKPIEASSVREELEIKGWSYQVTPVLVTLLRLVKKGELRRIKELKGKKTVYKYCNP